MLFVGDAEWQAKFKEGKGNSSWNTIWNRQSKLINKPVDFLKVGHHGSINATPWGEGIDRDPSAAYEPVDILNAVLPLNSTAKAAVSTERGRYKTIPQANLLVDLGGRIANSKKYGPAFKAAGVKPESIKLYKEYEKDAFPSAQPPRTDFENVTVHAPWVDILI
ncbi:hypothetical protein LZK75_36870 (plasmid) [Rhizobium leguminosarum]|nr:hypothetical protein LZK75_36870 [Rhizobium leguminosarum]